MRILKGLRLGFLGETRMGGENQRASLFHFWVILYARFIGNQSYLPSIRSLIAVHCRKRERATLQNTSSPLFIVPLNKGGYRRKSHVSPVKPPMHHLRLPCLTNATTLFTSTKVESVLQSEKRQEDVLLTTLILLGYYVCTVVCDDRSPRRRY